VTDRAVQPEEQMLMAVSFRPQRAPERAHVRRNPSRLRRRLYVERLEDRTLLSNTPVLVKDIDHVHHFGIGIPQFTSFQGETFFSALDGIHGIQIWKTDGTASGTALVTDTNSSAPYGGLAPYDLTAANGKLFFTSGNLGGLWATDGTPGGTVELANISVDRGSFTSLGNHYTGLVSFNNEVFFFSGGNVWKSDGTAAGTVMVTSKVFTPGSYYEDLTVANGALYFSGEDATTFDVGLWTTDGTDAGTVQVKDLTPITGRAPAKLTNVGGTLYFTDDSTQLWKSDGTDAGTVLVKAFSPGNLDQLTDVSGRLFFTADDGVHGNEVWTSDGTAAGTVLTKDINPGAKTSYPGGLTAVGGECFFTASDSKRIAQLWKSDGTAAGTVQVSMFRTPDPSISFLAQAFGDVFFQARDGIHGAELWKSDGTTTGTVLVKDINPDNASLGPGSYPSWLTFVNGKLYFSATDNVSGAEPFVSDGTAAGTVLVAQINQTTFGSYPGQNSNFAAVGSTLFFSADDRFHGTELWKSDGTDAGTVLVKDLNPGRKGLASSYPQYLTSVGGTLFFVTHFNIGKTKEWDLWKTDGTARGTVFLKNFGLSSYSPLRQLTAVGDTLFFTSNFEGHGRELWKSDGTVAGTALVKDINPGKNGSYPYGLTNVNGTLYFSANDGTHGDELWKSDGTAAGTVLVADINPGKNSSYPGGFTLFNGAVYFGANDGVHGSELWKTDGTAAGTMLVADINPGPGSSYPSDLVNANGTLYFFAAANGNFFNPLQLWKSDGTAAGTVKVADIDPTILQTARFNLTPFNNKVLFQTDGAGFVSQLWISDGTAAGTVMLFQSPGSIFTLPPTAQFTVVGNIVYFVADDGIHGPELWQTDGTVAGTMLNSDLFPGPIGSNPDHLINVNGTLFFSANDQIHGDELFKIAGSSSAASPAKATTAGGSVAGPAASLGNTVVNALLPAAPTAAPPVALWSASSSAASQANGPASPIVSVHAVAAASLASGNSSTRTTAFFAALSGAAVHVPSDSEADALDTFFAALA
jgi:ELWxxDGT repeat protein